MTSILHAYVEYLADDNNWYCINHRIRNYSGDIGRFGELLVDELDVGDDEDLFAQLANVDNIKSIDYMFEPRGLPNDVSVTIRSLSADTIDDDYSHSYATLRELAYWYATHPTLIKTGNLTPTQVDRFDKYGTIPKDWISWRPSDPDGRNNREWHTDNVGFKIIMNQMMKLANEQWKFFATVTDPQGLNYVTPMGLTKESMAQQADWFRLVYWFS